MGSNRACVIGAGAAGIATAVALASDGVDFDWFEEGRLPGGLWRYKNETGRSAVYDSLITNTSAPNMRLFDYAVPELGEDYLTHRQVTTYLETILDGAGLSDRVQLGTAVTSVEAATEGYAVTMKKGLQERQAYYSHVIVANGRNWAPLIPRWNGEFSGRIVHALDYKTPDILTGKRVVVAGFGNTAADIAVEAASCAERVILATRSGGYLSFRYSKGRPSDQGGESWRNHLPASVRRRLAKLKHSRRNVSAKVRNALEARSEFRSKPPVINDRIAGLIDQDRIHVCHGIAALDGSWIRFANGESAEADVIIAATGYVTSYPFFPAVMLEQNGNFVDRYLRVVPPRAPGLYFVGHAAVQGPVFPVLTEQAHWVAGLIAGKCVLPEGDKLEQMARKDSERNRRISSGVSRGEDTVEAYPYIAALRRAHGLPAVYPLSSQLSSDVVLAGTPG